LTRRGAPQFITAYGLGLFLQYQKPDQFSRNLQIYELRDLARLQKSLFFNCLWLAFLLRSDVDRMIRIEKSDNGDLVTFVLNGWMQKEDLQELETLLRNHNKQTVVLDLKGLRLVDREAVGFLAKFETDQAKITNCPPYIREWILREREQQ
jgi:ABC-type transporter Mla MlaB component